ncbi:MAG: hypothetical protein KJ579_04635 [Verrucomicrobia bacterium]|nr:hypothetical protein [Verrucomicrobiota bacterium]
MKTRSLLVAILCGVCATLVAVVVWQKRQLDNAAASVPSPVSVVLPPAVSPDGDVPAAKESVAEAPKPAPSIAAPVPAAVPPAKAPDPGPPAKQLMAALAKMTKDPQMKDALREQQRMAMDMTYGQLFKYLAARPETVGALKDLLLERQMALMDAGLGVMAASSAEQRTADGKKIVEMQKDFDTRIQGLLGADDYGMYKEYEDTQPERMQVTMFGQSLGGAEALSDAQQHDLIRAMYEERKAFKFSLPSDPSQDPSALFAPGAATRHVQELETLQARYTARAQAVLSPSQFEAFQKSQEAQRRMQAMGIRMAAQMMGAPEEGK